MTDVLDFEITILTPEQAAVVWKTQSRRAPDFTRYQNFVNGQDVGTSFDLPVPKGDPKNAAAIKYNFAEAAKDRTIVKRLAGVPNDGLMDVEGITKDDGTSVTTAFRHGEHTYKRQDDGSYAADPIKAPVVIRWKQDQSTVKETVTQDGKKGEVDVKKIHTLHGTIVNTEAVVKRGPRPKPADDAKPADGEAKPAGELKPEDIPAPFEDGTPAVTSNGSAGSTPDTSTSSPSTIASNPPASTSGGSKRGK